MRFPSGEWLDAVVAEANKDSAELESLGFCDIKLGLRVIGAPDGEVTLGLRLEGYDVASDGEVDFDEWKPDCVLEGPYNAWRTMIENIEANGAAEVTQTLNTLTMAEIPMRVTAENPLGRDLFYRYNQSLQEIFDRASRVGAEFAGASA